MEKTKQKELIAYAESFASFVIPKIDADEIILFGSVARGEASKESDIDLFFNIKDKEREKSIKKTLDSELKKFYNSRIFEMWSLKSIKNPIRFKIGNLEKWKLKRSVISDGIVLYGKYKGIPEKTRGFVLFNLKPIKDITKRNRIVRKLFGRKEQSYSAKGALEGLDGKALSPTSFLVPIGKSKNILDILNPEKLDFTFFEIWSDEFGAG